MEKNQITMTAFAKVNLSLAVLAKRPDGYHDIQSVMQAIALHDLVKVTLTEKKNIECLCGDLSGPENLAYRAAERFRVELGLEAGILIEIVKNIPVEAGLAGGSSDAAAVLRALNLLYAEPCSREELHRLAATLGADVAYCLEGGTQWASGIGDQLSPLPALPCLELVLIKPKQGINTGEAYRLFDREGISHPLDKDIWREALAVGETAKIISLLSNDLEQSSMHILPVIAEIKDDLLKAHCLGALMSGSGSAVFGIASSSEQAQAVAKRFREKGFAVWITHTIGRRDS